MTIQSRLTCRSNHARLLATRSSSLLHAMGLAFVWLVPMASSQPGGFYAEEYDQAPEGAPDRENDEYLSESPTSCRFPPDLAAPPEMSFTSEEALARGGDTHYRIVVRFLIVRRSNATGGLDESLLHYYMRDLNYGYRDTPFVFVQSPEVVYIDDSTHYNNIPDFATAIGLLNTYAKPGVVDHIITPTLFGGPPITGLNFVQNPRGNVVAYERIGHPHSIVFPPHEMGHVFWLYHPYETQFGTQCTSEVSCTNRGDLLCDTPASPIVHGGNTTATGIFFAQIPGPCNGDPLYAPLTDLYMEAGWPAGHVLRDRFTPGEVDRMVDTLHAVSSDLIGAQRPDFLVDCDGNGVDDVEEILAGDKQDLGRDLVPDVCQVLPRANDLLVSGMTGDVLNRVRFFDGQTGAFRETIWNGMTWVHQLRMGPNGLVYIARLTIIQRLDLRTGRTVDNFIDGVLEGAGTFVDLLFEPSGDILVLDRISQNLRRYGGATGEFMGVFIDLNFLGNFGPKYMEYGPDGNIYVVGSGTNGNSMQRFNAATGQSMGAFVTAGSGGLTTGQGLVFHTDGFLYVSNGTDGSVLRYDADTGAFDRVFVTPASGGLTNPHGLRFGPDGHLYVASRNSNSVKRYDGASGDYIDDFVAAGSGAPSDSSGLSLPAGLLFVPENVPQCFPSSQEDDCNNNGTSDLCDLDSGFSSDCNKNSRPDSCDIASAFSVDCQGNLIPDECELDAKTSQDCQANGIPDECDLMNAPFVFTSGQQSPFGAGFNQDLTIFDPPESLSTVTFTVTTSADLEQPLQRIELFLNGSLIGSMFGDGGQHCPADPQAGQVTMSADELNAHLIFGAISVSVVPSSAVDPFACGSSFVTVSLAYDTHPSSDDCDGNNIPDECQLQSGTSSDCQPNGVPDECDLAAMTSVDCQSNGVPDECELAAMTSLDCQANDIPDECDLVSGESLDANHNGLPDECESCSNNADCDDSEPCSFDRCIDSLCSYDVDARYGDIAGLGGSCGPDGGIDLSDILAVLDGFAGQYAEGCELWNIDIAGAQGNCEPNASIDLSDILAVLDAFQGKDRCCAKPD